jgi:hypothetical protein
MCCAYRGGLVLHLDANANATDSSPPFPLAQATIHLFGRDEDGVISMADAGARHLVHRS